MLAQASSLPLKLRAIHGRYSSAKFFMWANPSANIGLSFVFPALSSNYCQGHRNWKNRGRKNIAGKVYNIFIFILNLFYLLYLYNYSLIIIVHIVFLQILAHSWEAIENNDSRGLKYISEEGIESLQKHVRRIR